MTLNQLALGPGAEPVPGLGEVEYLRVGRGLGRAHGEHEVAVQRGRGDGQLGGQRAAVDLPGEHGPQGRVSPGQAEPRLVTR